MKISAYLSLASFLTLVTAVPAPLAVTPVGHPQWSHPHNGTVGNPSHGQLSHAHLPHHPRTAVPVIEAEADNTLHHLEKRAKGVYFCKDRLWRGGCWYRNDNFGLCINVPDDWNNQITSFGPDYGEIFCYLFEHWDCQGRSLKLQYPGCEDLTQFGFNDITSSFRCSVKSYHGKAPGKRGVGNGTATEPIAYLPSNADVVKAAKTPSYWLNKTVGV